MDGRWRARGWGTATALVLLATPVAAHVKPGQPAPPFAIVLPDGRRIPSPSLRGEVVILNRWATWCTPCRVELPALDAYYRTHAAQGLHVFAIGTRESARPDEIAAIQRGIAFPLARGLKGSGFGEIDGLPTSYVVDRRGFVRYALADTLDAAKLDRIVGPLLAEAAPAP